MHGQKISLSYDNMEEWEVCYSFEEKISEVIQKAIDAGYDKIFCEAVDRIKN